MTTKRLTALVPDPSGMTIKKNEQRKMNGTTDIFSQKVKMNKGK
jgi:hypothetical protein